MTATLRGTKFRALTSMRVLRDPFYWMARWRDTFGDPFLLQTLNGPVVMTGRPDAIKQIFLAKANTHKPFATGNAKNYMGEHSLLLQHGDAHKRQRKLLLPPFHGKRMKAYSSTMAELTRAHLTALEPGDIVTMLDLGQRISLDVILTAVFGFDIQDERDEFRVLVNDLMDSLHPSFMFAGGLQTALWPPWKHFASTRAAYEQRMTRKIAELRPTAQARIDILSMMISAEFDDGSTMSDQELLDQLNALLIAGHETTAITLAWTMYWLFRTPRALTRTREEIEALGPSPNPEAYTKLPYLGAVIKESMRIRPIVTEVLRTLTEPMELLGHSLANGITVAPCISLLHSNPVLYPQPDTFQPERFLEHTFSPYEYIPFGGGNRRCIGSAFAECELRIALGILLTEADFDLIDDHVIQSERRSITMSPAGGVTMRLYKHRSVSPVQTVESAP